VAERRLAALTDAELAAALSDVGASLAWPAARANPAAPDLATRVRARIVADDPQARPRRSGLQLRRALVLALVALAILAAVAAAVAFGVPGIRLGFGEPAITPPPVASPVASPGDPAPSHPPGANLGLGQATALDDVEERAGFRVRLPADPALGPPAATYVSPTQIVSLVWPASSSLPATADPRVGLLVTQFRGSVEHTLIEKLIDSGTNVEPVVVAGREGYWISGDPHFFWYRTPDGREVPETRRWVGDALLWNDGELTYRIETSLGRDAAVRMAEALE
jgi:hypothetical protein